MARDRTRARRWILRIAVTALPLCTPMVLLPFTAAQAQPASVLGDPVLKALHDRMVHKDHLSFAEMRRLADAGDSLAALLYGKRLAATNDPKAQPEAVHYYAMALFAGREGAVKAVISLLGSTQDAMPPARLRVIESSILAAASRGNREATSALAEMYLTGTPFGQNRPEAIRLLTRLAHDGDSKAALDLTMLYLRDAAPSADKPQLVQTYLTLASTSDDLSVRTMAENLMRQWPRQAFSPPDRPERILQ
jgi:TPR repeat protein